MLKRVLFFIMVVFGLLLREFLTHLSFLLLILSSFRLFSKKHLNQLTINITCIGVFAYYILTFGKLITPEIGLNFLFNVILLKFMESKKYRDEVMCIFGIILLTASGALFDKTLIYFTFFTVCFFLLLHYFSGLNGIKFFTFKNTRTYLKLSFFTVALFFIFPRIPNPIPFYLNAGGTGEIGYSPEINISDVERLEENDTKVFWAKLKEKKDQNELYWRGNIVSETDGWNWRPGPFDQGFLKVSELKLSRPQEYRLFIKTPYLFVFDASPTIIEANHTTYQSDSTNSFNSSYIRNSNRYYSEVSANIQIKERPGKHHLQHGLNDKTVEWIHKEFKGQTLEQIIGRYRQILIKNQFQYSWNPGKIQSIGEFFDKKIGFCTHYASSLALILRVKNYPARIISGFQGGRFNPYGQFYEVNQNDAHAWVEVWDNEKWLRVDPTSFIAPERIIMDYQEVVSNNFIVPFNEVGSGFSVLAELKFILGQWDFVFYQFMDQWDAIEQLSFFSRLKLTRGNLLFISLLTIAILLWILVRKQNGQNHRQKLWSLYLSYLQKKGIVYRGNFEELKESIMKQEWDQKEVTLTILDEFIRLFYADEVNDEKIRTLLKKLNQ